MVLFGVIHMQLALQAALAGTKAVEGERLTPPRRSLFKLQLVKKGPAPASGVIDC